MKKDEIRKLLVEAATEQKIANVYMKYNENYYNLIPISLNKQLLLAINEDDFIFDGFRVSRFRDIKAVRIKSDKCDEIVRSEGLFHNVKTPEIDLNDWYTVFGSLEKTGKNSIVEYETPEGSDDKFAIGKIDKVYKNCLYLYYFDADCEWEPMPWRIPYTKATSVTFGSRYIDVFSK